MKAIKKINNNVALCVDSNQTELIAFGKGIGFPIMPYEVDLNDISMTFYKVDKRFHSLITEIPDNIFEVSALIVKHAQTTLNCPLNPNLVVTLADHINFAIVRLKKYKKIKMLFSFEVEQFYPRETEIGRYAVNLIQKKLFITLPDSEITNIALHFVNAVEERAYVEDEADTEIFIGEIVDKIEQILVIKIDRNSFNYNRFAMHLRYYFKRMTNKDNASNTNATLIAMMKEKYPQIYECALEVAQLILKKYHWESSEDEILYLMLHINRMQQVSVS